jgi:hypothetical protein
MDQKRLLAAPKNFLRSAHKSLGRGPKALKGVIDAQDIAEVAKLSSQAVLAWSLPERAWWPVTRLLGRIEVTTHPKRTCREIADVEALLAGPEIAANPRRIVIENWANQYGERFQFLRAWRPGGWTPEIDIVGAGHVSAALARGRGVIFWGGNFSRRTRAKNRQREISRRSPHPRNRAACHGAQHRRGHAAEGNAPGKFAKVNRLGTRRNNITNSR